MSIVIFEPDTVTRGHLRCLCEMLGLSSKSAHNDEALFDSLRLYSTPQGRWAEFMSQHPSEKPVQAVLFGPNVNEPLRDALSVSLRAQLPKLDLYALAEPGDTIDRRWFNTVYAYPMGIDALLGQLARRYGNGVQSRLYDMVCGGSAA